MFTNELELVLFVVLAIAFTLQILTLWALGTARHAAAHWYDSYITTYSDFMRYRRNSIRRDPLTGRYVKEGK